MPAKEEEIYVASPLQASTWFSYTHQTSKNSKTIISNDIKINTELKSKKYAYDLCIGFTICNTISGPVGSGFIEIKKSISPIDNRRITVELKKLNLMPGQYYFNLSVGHVSAEGIYKETDVVLEVLHFEVIKSNSDKKSYTKWDETWGGVKFENSYVYEDFV